MSIVAWVSVSVTDTAGEQIAGVVVDSALVDGNGTIPVGVAGDLTTLKGVSYRLRLVDGRIEGWPAPSVRSVPTNALGGAIAILFAGHSRRIKAGGSWADTVRVEEGNGTSTGVSEVITDWKATPSGERGTVLNGTSTGTGRVSEGSTTKFTSRSTGEKRVSISPNGDLVSANSATKTDTIVEGNAPALVEATRTVTVTLVPS